MNIDEKPFTQLLDTILFINDTHSRFSIHNEENLSINLKKKRIEHLFDMNESIVDSDFMEYTYGYTSLLRNIYPDLLGHFGSISSFDYRVRIKERGSIDNKVYRYTLENHQFGNISINKCLNDLIGFRVILDDFNNLKPESELRLLVLCEQLKIKVVPRVIDKYQGTHLYFKNNNNYYFPWELQIWDSKNEVRNNDSHEEHQEKRKYIAWPSEYKKGKIEEG